VKEAEAMRSETEQAEQIRQLIEENRRLQRQIRELKSAAAAKKKVETSKLIFVGVSVLTVAITVFACRMIWITKDTSALAYLIPAVFTEMAAATGFYYNKAKAENKIKLMAAYKVKPEASDFNDH
jgi:hypothetical protein